MLIPLNPERHESQNVTSRQYISINRSVRLCTQHQMNDPRNYVKLDMCDIYHMHGTTHSIKVADMTHGSVGEPSRLLTVPCELYEHLLIRSFTTRAWIIRELRKAQGPKTKVKHWEHLGLKKALEELGTRFHRAARAKNGCLMELNGALIQDLKK